MSGLASICDAILVRQQLIPVRLCHDGMVLRKRRPAERAGDNRTTGGARQKRRARRARCCLGRILFDSLAGVKRKIKHWRTVKMQANSVLWCIGTDTLQFFKTYHFMIFSAYRTFDGNCAHLVWHAATARALKPVFTSASSIVLWPWANGIRFNRSRFRHSHLCR